VERKTIMKKQQIRLIALPGLILAGTLSFAIPLSAQETEKAEEQVGKYMEKLPARVVLGNVKFTNERIKEKIFKFYIKNLY
jgi:hypothetical protein